jgi:membrane peptidoglycan carboxypeptidase
LVLKSKKTILIFAVVIGFLAFVPRVFVLELGIVTYDAYEADGVKRFSRTTGPLTPYLSNESNWAPSSEINPSCIAALLATEDTTFFSHYGIEPLWIRIAAERNQRHGKIVWGGSTITQQIVKNIFLTREKTFFRKVREAAGALLLDRIMSKEAQLDWYLNVAEFGPHIYGIGDAAKIYFARSARELSLAQCVKLFSVLTDPARSYRSLLAPQFSEETLRRYQNIFLVLAQLRLVPADEILQAVAEI